ncbi:type 2 lanthipeptide synthetase LanM family protein [Amycolatopsis pigmentata]|uniref:Type 2 lanthipeptide synthetase LanM family protein n=1 Tax=Amycolatopsis pigmentata TaxID=450801 RepID=A0ABW5FXY3_9PSEU
MDAWLTEEDRRAWRRAALLPERRPPEGVEPVTEPVVERWRERMFVGEELFGSWLNSRRLDRTAFRRLLAAPEPEVVPDPPPWLPLLCEAYADQQPPPAPGADDHPFAGFVRPLVRAGAARLRKRLADQGLLPALTEPVARQMRGALARRLLGQCTRTLVLELNVARVRGLLRGDGPRERFRYFQERFLDDTAGRRALFREYPVLARIMVDAVGQWVDATEELLVRVVADRALIARTFYGGEPVGPLVSVTAGWGDAHHRGRSVTCVEFGGGLRLVYKPVPLAVDAAFADFVSFVNRLGPRHPHRTIQVLNRGGYGWVEHIGTRDCDSPAAVERFYWRQGGFLALFHLLRAVDFHQENLIAAGEYPVPVDLETLFHNEIPAPERGDAYHRALGVLAGSVLATGLLPIRLFGADGRAGVDLSGLGGAGGQTMPRPVPVLKESFTDTMHVGGDRPTIPEGRNRPRLAGVPVAAGEHVEAVIAGFTSTYDLLAANREAVAMALEPFREVRVRHLVRLTRRYLLFIQEGHHPDHLRDGLDREALFAKLWAEAEAIPALARVAESEMADLHTDDVPMFSATPDRTDLRDSRGEVISGFFERSGWELVHERLARLGPEDRERQVEIIRGALLPPPETRLRRPRDTVPVMDRLPGHDEFLDAAVEIGESLAATAIRGDEDATWIGPRLDGSRDDCWQLAPLATTLYDGTAGVAVFFGCLARATGRADFADIATAAAVSVRQHLRYQDPGGRPTGIGAFNGRSGLAYALHQLGGIVGEETVRKEILAGLGQLRRQISQDTQLDIIGGAAGCAAVLLNLHTALGAPELLDGARECGEHLLHTAREDGDTLCWRGASSSRPLAGFSHGQAGIIWALLRIAEATGENRFTDAALRGLRYERRLFVPAEKNWQDRRDSTGDTAIRTGGPVQWCHGAPGVAIGRLLCLRVLPGDRIREEALTGLETTLRQGFTGASHCLCHGDLGNLEVLTLAAAVTAEPGLRDRRERLAARILATGRQNGWRCGVAPGIHAPGLMTGLAGIGLGLLRVWSPETIPATLWLELPQRHSTPYPPPPGVRISRVSPGSRSAESQPASSTTVPSAR